MLLENIEKLQKYIADTSKNKVKIMI